MRRHRHHTDGDHSQKKKMQTWKNESLPKPEEANNKIRNPSRLTYFRKGGERAVQEKRLFIVEPVGRWGSYCFVLCMDAHCLGVDSHSREVYY